MVLITSAAGAANGAAFTTQPVVAVRDAARYTRTSDNSTVVTMSVSAGGTLLGTATATAVSGVATFSNVGIVGTAGTSYTLTFASGVLTPATQNITLTTGAVATVSVSPNSSVLFVLQTTQYVAALAKSKVKRE